MIKVASLVEKLLISIFLLPLILAIWYFYSANSVIITEIVPSGQGEIPIPNKGDRIFVYGEWVRDEGHMFGNLYNWHEIHPIRYLKNFNTGEEGGEMPYNAALGEGAWNKKWLIILDPNNPLQNASGIVTEAFGNPEDGDVHIHILPDKDSQYLVRFPSSPLRLDLFPMFEFWLLNFEQSIALIASLPLTIFLLYIVLSVRYPKETFLGKLMKRFKHEN